MLLLGILRRHAVLFLKPLKSILHQVTQPVQMPIVFPRHLTLLLGGITGVIPPTRAAASTWLVSYPLFASRYSASKAVDQRLLGTICHRSRRRTGIPGAFTAKCSFVLSIL